MNDNEQDRRIDQQLQAAFEPPDAREFATMAERVTRPAAPPEHPWWAWLAAAAALISVFLLLFSEPSPRRVGPEGHDAQVLGAMWVAAYEDAAARDFSGGCCETPFDLPQACENKYSCRVDVTASGRVSVVGGYCGLETGGCIALIARDGDTPVCVYVVPRDQDPRVVIPGESVLHLARRELGELVLYALSPAPADVALKEFVEL